jgi:hypothetical protein
MLKADVTTVEGRQKLVDHVIHESHLEGHEVTNEMRELYFKYIAGNITMEQVKQARIAGIAKVACYARC